MKLVKYIFIFSLVVLMAGSCQKGLDPIESVTPEPDAASPTVVINYPIEGKPFVSPDEIATIVFKLVAADDAELKSVVLVLDGAEIANFTEFKDYRRLDLKYSYSNMAAGAHVFTVNVEDMVGNTATSTVNFNKVTAPLYTPLTGEVAYFPLDEFNLDLISGNELTLVGFPGYATGKVNECYEGATDAYMTFPSAGFTTGKEFSVVFWYKINAVPDRAGIMAITPPSEDRTVGFRLFREISGADQNIGLNFGDGITEKWMNPFVKVAPDADWIHIAISISSSIAIIYVNGAEAPLNNNLETTGVVWTGCGNIVSIGSGMPDFVYWQHFSDLSLYDEIHFFNRAITADEVQSFYAVKK